MALVGLSSSAVTCILIAALCSSAPVNSSVSFTASGGFVILALAFSRTISPSSTCLANYLAPTCQPSCCVSLLTSQFEDLASLDLDTMATFLSFRFRCMFSVPPLLVVSQASDRGQPSSAVPLLAIVVLLGRLLFYVNVLVWSLSSRLHCAAMVAAAPATHGCQIVSPPPLL